MLTQSRLKELLDYNPNTGIFVWKVVTSNRVKVGMSAGAIRKDGYISVRLDKQDYLSHRLAWLFVYSIWPSKIIDHKDTIRHHNWIDNLRDISNEENTHNTKRPSKNNTTGFLGVCFDKSRSKFISHIQVAGKNKYLGRFETAQEASSVYLQAKIELHSGYIA